VPVAVGSLILVVGPCCDGNVEADSGSPAWLMILASTPALTSAVTTSGLPPAAAECSAVRPRVSRMFGSAPAFTSARTRSAFPARAASIQRRSAILVLVLGTALHVRIRTVCEQHLRDVFVFLGDRVHQRCVVRLVSEVGICAGAQ